MIAFGTLRFWSMIAACTFAQEGLFLLAVYLASGGDDCGTDAPHGHSLMQA